MNKQDMIEKFMGRTGYNSKTAEELLRCSDWNEQLAYLKYEQVARQMRSKYAGQPSQMGVGLGVTRPQRGGGGLPLHHPTYGRDGYTNMAVNNQYTGTGAAIRPLPRYTQHPYVSQVNCSQVPGTGITHPHAESHPRERIIPIQVERGSVVKSVSEQTSHRTSELNDRPLPFKNSMSPALRTVATNNGKQQLSRQTIHEDNVAPNLNRPIGENRPHSVTPQETKLQSVFDEGVASESSEKSSASATKQPPKTDNQGSSTPRLKRGISKIVENADIVDETRNSLLHDIEEDSHNHMYIQTFILPDLTIYSEDFRAFLEKDLVETSTLVSLEQAGRLNWWADMGLCQRLLPMATTGDGNCLLHAASLAMWGIHDRQLMLRKALYSTLTKKHYRHALYRRWRYHQTLVNMQSGLILSEEEWQVEWENILKLASTTPRCLPGITRKNSSTSCCDSPVTQGKGATSPTTPVVYESLEDFHVFVLAHVLQRAIIVVADTVLKDAGGEALAPIPFGGIYVPLECSAAACHRFPLLLTYDAAHFSALVPMEKHLSTEELPVALPLVGPELNLLPIHFSRDPGVSFQWAVMDEITINKFKLSLDDQLNLLQQYLDIEKMVITNLDFDNDSEGDRKSSGSYESDEGSGLIGKEKKKDSKVSQQLQTVTKQFGSFGKSMGKKLKNIGKAMKAMGPDNEKGSRKPSIGSGVTQSTRLPLTILALVEQDQSRVWCAKLSSKQSAQNKQLIGNYLHDAQQRFEKDRELKRKKGDEIRNRLSQDLEEKKSPHKCVTPGCNLFGNPETHYLCSQCFTELKQQAIDQEKNKNQKKINLFPGKTGKINEEVVQKVGKSKFYAPAVEEGLSLHVELRPGIAQGQRPQSADPRSKASVLAKPAIEQRPSSAIVSTSQTMNNRPLVSVSVNRNGDVGSLSQETRKRTPSPDYDNVDYAHYKKGIPPQPPLKVKDQRSNAALKCRNTNCEFFGSEDKEFLCSACYKEKHKTSAPIQIDRQTKL
ncbi:hypothetical protein ScPMuIL_018805 [Solemya velum]